MNKEKLQVNNTDLSTILSKIGDLPLKALVEAAAREGQYVWAKYQRSKTQNLREYIDTMLSGEYDLGTNADEVTVFVANSYKKNTDGTYSLPNPSSYTVYSGTGTAVYQSYVIYGSPTGSVMFYAGGKSDRKVKLYANKIVITAFGINSKKYQQFYEDTYEYALTSYATSNNPKAYPDGEEMGGFYWERINYGQIDFGEFTVVGNVTDHIYIPHGLKVKPSRVYIIAKDTLRANTSGMSVMGLMSETAVCADIGHAKYFTGLGAMYAYDEVAYTRNAITSNENTIRYSYDGYDPILTANATYYWIAIA